MNWQEAAEYFARKRDTLIWGLKDNRDETRQAHDAYNKAIDSLCGPQPDPITGLVPCGCGGKAEFYEPDDEFYMVGVECSQCYVSTCATCDKEHATHDWNRAMGCYKGGAE